jgi:hypothetical protein
MINSFIKAGMDKTGGLLKQRCQDVHSAFWATGMNYITVRINWHYSAVNLITIIIQMKAMSDYQPIILSGNTSV